MNKIRGTKRDIIIDVGNSKNYNDTFKKLYST